MDILVNWLVALVVVLLFFWGLYIIIKLAVKSAVREAFNEVGSQLAKKLWDEDTTPEA